MHKKVTKQLVGVAQIGCGILGRALFTATEDHQKFKNVIVCDSNESQATALKSGSDLQTTVDYKKAIAHPEAQVIFVNTPAETHYNVCMQAITSKKHVFCAKPLVLNALDAQRLVKVAKDQHVSLTVGHQLKYSNHIQFLKELLDSNIVGEVSGITFINNKRRLMPGNLSNQKNSIIWEMTSHHLDAIFYVFAAHNWSLIGSRLSRPTWSQYQSNTRIDAILESDHGVPLIYQAGFDSLKSNYYFRIEGSLGVLDIMGDHFSSPISHYLFTQADGFSKLLKPTKRKANSWKVTLDKLFLDYINPNTTEIAAERNLGVLELIEQIQANES